jgi:hypothetical protein
MSRNFALGVPLESLGYRTDNEEILGYLLHGLAEWHFGTFQLGTKELEYFQQHLPDVKDPDTASATAASLKWLDLYGTLVNYYQPDFALAHTALKPRGSGTIDELRSALEEIEADPQKAQNQRRIPQRDRRMEGRPQTRDCPHDRRRAAAADAGGQKAPQG